VVTPELLKHLKHEEGFVGHVYKCPAGYDTIGYGHRVDDPRHPPMTEAEATELLIEDVKHYESVALRLSPGLAQEPPHRLDAITDFIFNLGGAAYSGSILRLKVNKKLWTEAAEQMRRWCHYRDPKTGKMKVLQGLVDRREVAARWLEHPTDSLPPAA
jgi:lysozyme